MFWAIVFPSIQQLIGHFSLAKCIYSSNHFQKVGNKSAPWLYQTRSNTTEHEHAKICIEQVASLLFFTPKNLRTTHWNHFFLKLCGGFFLLSGN